MKKLSRLGDSLVCLNKVITWEIFRPVLDKALRKESKGKGGRPPYDTPKEGDTMRELFDAFYRQFADAHIITHTGSIVDATFVDAPRQRNTREGNAKSRQGKYPRIGKEGNANKLRQKATDARWTKKGNETHYGYKDHVKADAESKLITHYTVTSTNVMTARHSWNLWTKMTKCCMRTMLIRGRRSRRNFRGR